MGRIKETMVTVTHLMAGKLLKKPGFDREEVDWYVKPRLRPINPNQRKS